MFGDMTVIFGGRVREGRRVGEVWSGIELVVENVLQLLAWCHEPSGFRARVSLHESFQTDRDKPYYSECSS